MKQLTQLILILIGFQVCAQENYVDQYVETPRDIPSAPAFSLLGVNPEFISKPSDIKNFKVDWRIKNYQIAPDLALEGQPLWWLFFNNKSMRDFKNASRLNKILSTTSLSFGTAKLDGVNHMAYAVKWNVFKGSDQKAIEDLYKEFESSSETELSKIQNQIDSLSLGLNTLSRKEKRSQLAAIAQLKNQKREIEKNMLSQYRDALVNLQFKTWNSSFLELAIGRVYTYNNGGLDSLKINGAGYGLWVTGGKPIKPNGLLSGMIRYNRIGENSDFYLGAAYRYGSQNYNFFSELIYTRKGNSIDNGFDEGEFFQENYSEDLGISWLEFGNGNAQTQITMSYGGEFKLRKNILLNFALKTRLDSSLKFDKLIPTANVVCIME